MGSENYEKNVDDFHRAINFYRLYRLVPAAPGRAGRIQKSEAPSGWLERLEEVSSYPIDERTIDGIVYDIEVDGDSAKIGMHKLLDPALMSRLNTQDGTIDDFKIDYAEGQVRLAHASAVAIAKIRGALVFAIARGSSAGVPRQRAVKRFFNEFFRQEHVSWEQTAVTSPGDIQRLKEFDRIKFFTGKFVEDPRDFGGQLGKLGRPRALSRKLATSADGKVEVGMKVSEPNGDKETQAALYHLVEESIQGIYRGSIRTVGAVNDDEEVVLNLIEHDLASSIFLPPEERIGLKFSSLLSRVQDELLKSRDIIDHALMHKKQS